MNDFRTVDLNIGHKKLVWIHCSFRNPVLISVNKGKSSSWHYITGWIKLQHTRIVKNLPTANRWFKIYLSLSSFVSTFTLLIITLSFPRQPPKKLCMRMVHFRVAPNLCFKTRLRAKLLKRKWFFYSHCYKRGFALILVLKVRAIGTRKWPVGFNYFWVLQLSQEKA